MSEECNFAAAPNVEAWLTDLFNAGFKVNLSFQPNAKEFPWSAHAVRVATSEDEEPTSYNVNGENAAQVTAKLHCDLILKQSSKLLPLEKRFSEFINANCLENESNTPDFLLGEFSANTLAAVNRLIRARDKWYGVKLAPGERRCAEYETMQPIYLRPGALFKIGKRLWRLIDCEGNTQGNDSWKFEYTEKDNECVDKTRRFSTSELRWLYGHGALVGQPAEGEGRGL